MRIRPWWPVGVFLFGLFTVVAALGVSGRDATSTPNSGTSAALANGVTISSRCDQSESAEHVAFSSSTSHKFLGYGVNVQIGKAEENIPRTIADVKKLGFVWVRIHLGLDDSGPNSETGSSDGESRADAPSANDGAGVQRRFQEFFSAAHAAGIKIVNWGEGRGTAAFFESTAQRNGKFGSHVRSGSIPSLAQYIAEDLHSVAHAGIRPDLMEPFNEPNLKKHKFEPADYAELIKDIEENFKNDPSDLHLAAPGTASNLSQGVDFVRAMQAQGSLSGLKAITVHTYYVRDRPTNFGVPSANDPALQTLLQTAKGLGVPLISTEFGGTDLKTKDTDPDRESVDPAEEFKAALDLIEAGESAALVWELYPNFNGGALLKSWALIDNNGPTNAYWPFILTRRIPVGADVLNIERTDIGPTMTSLGYAAFRDGRTLYVGLSNPASSQVTVALDLSRIGSFTVVHAASFLPTRTTEQDTAVHSSTCPLTVTVPSGTGAMFDINEAH
jgi:hypothetical protein